MIRIQDKGTDLPRLVQGSLDECERVVRPDGASRERGSGRAGHALVADTDDEETKGNKERGVHLGAEERACRADLRASARPRASSREVAPLPTTANHGS